MVTEGRIADGSSGNFVPWEPIESLEAASAQEVRYSRGFLPSDPTRCLTGMAEHWLAFFLNLGTELRIFQVRKHLAYPQDLARITVLEANGESALVGIDESTQSAILATCASQLSEGAADVVLEYFERRFASSLTKAWSTPTPFVFRYPSAGWADEVEVIGAIEVQGALAGRPVVFWFGLGPQLTDECDVRWREYVAAREATGGSAHDDRVHTVTAELAQLAVPPAMLIDYLRSGTVVDLEVPYDMSVALCLDGQPWGNGELRQVNNLFAVEIVDLDTTPAVTRSSKAADATTRVSVEIARVEIDAITRPEYEQPGALIATPRPAKGIASLVINGEVVASATVGRLGEHLALRILPR